MEEPMLSALPEAKNDWVVKVYITDLGCIHLCKPCKFQLIVFPGYFFSPLKVTAFTETGYRFSVNNQKKN
jgi:hypothetical protein